MSEIGSVLDRLMATVLSRKGADPSTSYTASLLSKGPARCAKKFGEEAVEAALAGALGDKDELAAESADVLYHLAVLLAANDVTLDDVAAKLAEREGTSGHEEKASRTS
ncbi:phosphoribosyl-ATP diphosphatase [Parvularcula sp. LCG005]|uniref:phosphoribosyl-ATP diphosphatase n=1 Tax=Parvularcula sp. LCG005 TaxID=3078805 RepID=UPI0029428CCD|nr:phosphoribosyl-ATP diphosphatase [Parvularcula sp. LCG005]WOI53546.1 phosphoribosyl-ATP diphosphatase [Parvularcula sp. LCG005]